MDVVVDEENLPTEAFKEDTFLEVWNAYIANLEAKREFNMASILSLAAPKVSGSIINLTFPNETNKIELERESYDILNHLRKTLNNYDISFNINVNEVLQKQYAYTPQEKYDKLIVTYPNLELLKSMFDLDIN